MYTPGTAQGKIPPSAWGLGIDPNLASQDATRPDRRSDVGEVRAAVGTVYG